MLEPKLMPTRSYRAGYRHRRCVTLYGVQYSIGLYRILYGVFRGRGGNGGLVPYPPERSRNKKMGTSVRRKISCTPGTTLKYTKHGSAVLMAVTPYVTHALLRRHRRRPAAVLEFRAQGEVQDRS